VRALIAIAAVVGSGAALGCAPPASFRPPSGLLDGKTAEVGGGGMLIGPRPYVEEPVRGVGQVWASTRASRAITVSGVVAFDPTAFAVGGAGRFDFVRTRRVAVGGEVELGFAWVGAVVPAGLRLFDETWLYTGPRLATRGFDSTGIVGGIEIPAGLSVRLVDGLMLRAEYRIGWTDLLRYTERHHAGLAVAYQL
jgi:hypothetical protein